MYLNLALIKPYKFYLM